MTHHRILNFINSGEEYKNPKANCDTGYQKKQTVQLDKRLRIRDSTPASALPKFSGCVPPA